MIAVFMFALAVAPQTSEPPRIWAQDEVQYTRRPMPDFPMSARANRGQVYLICTATGRGTVSGCQIESETPAGEGFGRAAVQSMRGARISKDQDSPAAGDLFHAKILFWNGQGDEPL